MLRVVLILRLTSKPISIGLRTSLQVLMAGKDFYDIILIEIEGK
jgi:hypothetical protein